MAEARTDTKNKLEDQPESKEKKPEAKRLVLFLPGIKKSTENTIVVGAVTDEGKIDTSRDDSVEFSINHESRLRFTDSSKVKQLQLVNGEAKVNVLSDQLPEVTIMKIRWISGKTPLQNTQVSYLVGSH
jgi:hypothetical protein